MNAGIFFTAIIGIPLAACPWVWFFRERPNFRDGVAFLAGALMLCCVVAGLAGYDSLSGKTVVTFGLLLALGVLSLPVDTGLVLGTVPLDQYAGWLILVALGIKSAFPRLLTDWLPYPASMDVYTTHHVVSQLQLLAFTALALALALRWHLFAKRGPSKNLDADWLYRDLPRMFWNQLGRKVLARVRGTRTLVIHTIQSRVDQLTIPMTWPISQSVMLIVFLLFAMLLLDFFYKA